MGATPALIIVWSLRNLETKKEGFECHHGSKYASMKSKREHIFLPEESLTPFKL